jgi:hypothetical protein
LTALVLIFLLVGFTTRAAELLDFQGHVDGETTVVLTWNLADETGIQGFTIKRSTNATDFYPCTDFLPADGSLHYTITDNPINPKLESDRTYYYQLFFVENSGAETAVGNVVQVNLEVSTITLTWGTLKAMFR